jgi:hypothetical protein
MRHYSITFIGEDGWRYFRVFESHDTFMVAIVFLTTLRLRIISAGVIF